MEKLIACCGLDCTKCDARIATVTNDHELRTKTAETWSVQYSAASLTAEMINCTGCREAGAKFNHCRDCEIRNCVAAKGFQTCADCEMLEDCPKTKSLHQYLPEALQNLRSLN